MDCLPSYLRKGVSLKTEPEEGEGRVILLNDMLTWVV